MHKTEAWVEIEQFLSGANVRTDEGVAIVEFRVGKHLVRIEGNGLQNAKDLAAEINRAIGGSIETPHAS